MPDVSVRSADLPLPELLAPAGSPEALGAALRAGADAVYLGAKGFNARANARNFTDGEFAAAARDCHAAGARIYATLNTLVTEREYPAALASAAFMREAGVDALIVADLGLARELRLNFPDLPLHASTQAGVHNSDGAKAMRELGFERVVAARELRAGDIAAVVAAGVPVEIFVHGALCVCHSGQCLFSSLVGGRSGNRGECAQPCRLAYNGSYPLSLKDNCLAGHVREILALGVASLKIEGRMKSPDYVYAVTRKWRELLDEGRDARPGELAEMARVFSREGFTDGYFTGRIGRDMNGVRSEKDKRMTRAAPAPSGAPAPRRDPLAHPEREPEKPVLHPAVYAGPARGVYSTARFADPASIPKKHPFETVYLPLEKFDPDRANGVVVPPVVTDSDRARVADALREAARAGAVHALVGNLGHLPLALDASLTPHADLRLGAYSAATAKALCDAGFADVIFSPELTVPQLRDIAWPKGAVVYGRLPLMLLEKRLGARTLRDRRGVVFPVLREWGRDVVCNSVVTYMADRRAELERAGITERHFIFTGESREEVARVIAAYEKQAPPASNNVRRIK